MTTLTEMVAVAVVHSSAAALSHFGVMVQPAPVVQAAHVRPALSVPERTLRLCCAEFLGVSPVRYYLLRRLNMARSALRRANPETASVAEIARDHQFVELGRFAVA